MKRQLKRQPAQRKLNLSLPISAYETLRAYCQRNGCQQPAALSLAVDRYGRLVETAPPPAKVVGAKGQGETVSVIVTLPLELQTSVDRWAVEYNSFVNQVVAKAIQEGLD